MTEQHRTTTYAEASGRSEEIRRQVEAAKGDVDPSRRTTRLVGIPMDESHGMTELDPAARSQHLHMPAVNITNGGSFYRPWKEELYLSGWKTFGNFLAWPFRLVGRLLENILMMCAGFLRTLLIFVIGPLMLFTGYGFYQTHKGMPAAQVAEELGRDAVHIVGAAGLGVWHGVFGGGPKETAAVTTPATDPTIGDQTPQERSAPRPHRHAADRDD